MTIWSSPIQQGNALEVLRKARGNFSPIYEAVLPLDNNKLELVAVLHLCNCAEIRHLAALAGPWTQSYERAPGVPSDDTWMI